MEPTRADEAPPPALGLAPALAGGQLAAHAPEHFDLFLVSFSNRYSVRPLASTRIVPSDVCRALIVAVEVFELAMPAPPAPTAAVSARAVAMAMGRLMGRGLLRPGVDVPPVRHPRRRSLPLSRLRGGDPPRSRSARPAPGRGTR